MIHQVLQSFTKLAFLFFTFLAFSLQGQVLYVGPDQLISVSEGAILHLDDDIENEGTLENSGEIEVYGDWLNTGNYVPLNGQLSFAGSQTQIIDHNGQSISRLYINNTQGVSFNSDVTVTSELDLAAGLLTVRENNRLLLDENTEILGTGPEAYVNGRLVCRGTGYRYFPVGDQENFLPVELLDVAGTEPEISVEVQRSQPAPLSLERLDLLSRSYYWEVLTTNGTYEGSLVRLDLYGGHDFENITGLVVAAADELGGTYRSLGQSELLGTLSDGTVTSEVPTNLPIISLAKSDEFSLEGEVLVPNAFAPDSPLEDDRYFSIFTVNLLPDQFVFRIFNRWGHIVYETESLEEARESGWNGINQQTNEPAQFGVYSYYLSGMFSNGETIVKKGSLTLFR